MLGQLGVFRDIGTSEADKSKSRSRSRSASPINGVKNQNPFRLEERKKKESNFLFHLWNFILNPLQEQEVQFEIANEALKVLFNHYLQNYKQAELLYELQNIVDEIH